MQWFCKLRKKIAGRKHKAIDRIKWLALFFLPLNSQSLRLNTGDQENQNISGFARSGDKLSRN